MKKNLPKLVIILGPTAAGKTELACRLAVEFGFEIISADSLLVYKHMDVGTAKPSKRILKHIPHHLIDILEPSEDFNAGMFKLKAQSIIENLYILKKKILIVGGTYLYIKVLTEGIIENIQTDKKFRHDLKIQRYLYGNKYIHDKLKSVDMLSSEKINSNDYVRMERALEVFHLTGVRLSELQDDHGFSDRKFDVIKIGLRIDNEKLKERIRLRTTNMLEGGLMNEVNKLRMMGYGKNTKPLGSIGYRELLDYLSGGLDMDQLSEKIIRNTKRLAKKQMTWLKRDSEIKWFDVPYSYDDIKKEIELFYSDDG